MTRFDEEHLMALSNGKIDQADGPQVTAAARWQQGSRVEP
jgi:hypothetical protein